MSGHSISALILLCSKTHDTWSQYSQNNTMTQNIKGNQIKHRQCVMYTIKA